MHATDARADRTLRRAFRAHPELTNQERADAARWVHGVRCHERRLRHLLRDGGLPEDPPHRIAAYRAHVQGEPDALPRPIGDVIWPEDPVERIAVHHSAPTWLTRRLVEERGLEDTEALLEALNQPGPITIRANAAMNDRDTLTAILEAEGVDARPDPAAPHALTLALDPRPDIRGSPAYLAGRFEVQDAGNQRIAEAVRAAPGDVILDWCAGAGGKTLALAAALEGPGQIYAADPNPDRLHDLRTRIKRVNPGCIDIRDHAALPMANKILVDAPCTAVGTWRRGPDRKWHITRNEADGLPARQLSILEEASAHLLEDGALVYATCTLLRAENQDVVDAFLRRNPAFKLRGTQELTPHGDGTDGFWWATLERRHDAPGG